MAGNCAEESIQHSEHGESLKSRTDQKWLWGWYCTQQLAQLYTKHFHNDISRSEDKKRAGVTKSLHQKKKLMWLDMWPKIPCFY